MPEREWLPSELARRDEVGRFGHERDAAHALTLQQAFSTDPLFEWIYSDRSQGQQLRFWQLVLQGSPRGAEIHALQTSGAVAIWLPPVESTPESPTAHETETPEDSSEPSIRELMADVLGERAVTIFELFGAIHLARPEEPHWYLQAVGTRPELQGNGLGSRVLALMLERCDRLGVLTYLESSNPQNHAFYHRHGFVSTGEIGGPDTPTLMQMRREASS